MLNLLFVVIMILVAYVTYCLISSYNKAVRRYNKVVARLYAEQAAEQARLDRRRV
jgi:uncharacterized protein (UPF0333 family)